MREHLNFPIHILLSFVTLFRVLYMFESVAMKTIPDHDACLWLFDWQLHQCSWFSPPFRTGIEWEMDKHAGECAYKRVVISIGQLQRWNTTALSLHSGYLDAFD